MSQGPIMDRKSEGYTRDEIKKLALGDSVKSKEFRKNLLDFVQTGLTRSKENIVLTNNSISWIIEHLDSLPVEMVVPKGSINSGWDQKNDSVYFFPIKEDWDGFVYVFRYGKCTLPLIKASCCNLLSVIKKTEIERVIASNSNSDLAPLSSNPENQSSTGTPIVNVNVTNTNTIDFGPLIEALKANQPAPVQPAVDKKIDLGSTTEKVDEKKPTWWDKNGDKVVIGGLVLGTGTALYFLLRDKGGPVGAPGHDDGILGLKFSF